MILNIPPTLSQIRAGTLGVDLQMGAKAILLGATASASSGNSLAGMSAQLWINATTKQVFAIGGSGKMSLTSTGLFIDGSGEYLRLGASGIAANTNSDNGIAGRSTGMEYASTTGTPHKWFVAATEYMRLTHTLLEAGKISLGGTLGSSVDPGAGGLGLTGNIQFTGAGSASSELSQIYSDANAGSIFINCPTSRAIQLLYNGVQKFYVGSAGAVAAGPFYVNQNQYFSGAGAASSTFTTSWADASNGNLFTNVPTGKYEQHRVAGAGLLSLGRQQGVQGDDYWAIGGWAANGTLSNAVSGIFAITGMGFNVPTGNAYQFNFAGVEKYRFSAALAEFDRLSLGGTIGSSTDPGAGGLYLTGSSNIRGGQKVAVSTKTTTYTATSSDYIILGNHASTPFTINLPAATGSGQVFIIKNINTAAVTVDANASETIDGSLTQVLATNNSITIVDYAAGLWAII